MRPSVFLGCLLWMGCTAAGQGPAAAPTPTAAGAAGSVAGTLRLVGSSPVNIRLVVQDAGGSKTITGPLREELRRLAGAEVVLYGRVEGGGVVPTDYRIRAIDGRPVTMGVVEAISGDHARMRTSEDEILYLVTEGDEFTVGQKVWVQGPPAVIVQTYGIIRP